jgi:hypothetical protein
MTLPVKETPVIGVLDGQEADAEDVTAGVQPPPLVTVPPQPMNRPQQRGAK